MQAGCDPAPVSGAVGSCAVCGGLLRFALGPRWVKVIRGQNDVTQDLIGLLYFLTSARLSLWGIFYYTDMTDAC